MKFWAVLLTLLMAFPAWAETPSDVKLFEEGSAASNFASGTVTWSLEKRKNGTNTSDVIVAGEVEIRERGLRLLVTLTKAPPTIKTASYFFEIYLNPREFARVTGVSAISDVLVEPGQTQAGSPLTMSGSRSYEDNPDLAQFLLAITDKPERRGYNMQLINENDWLVFPLHYGNKSKAYLKVQKGSGGNAVFAQAFAAWGLRPITNPIMKSAMVKRLGLTEKSSQLEAMQAIRNQVMACWPTPKVDPPPEVSIMVHYNIDGTLYGEPEIVRLPDDTSTPEATAIAVDAIKTCQPVRVKGPFEHWRTMEVVFGGR